MKFNKQQLKTLEQFNEMLISMAEDRFYGAVLSSKQKILGQIYDEVATNRCAGCNNNWIFRLARWYYDDIKEIESKSKLKTKRKVNKKVKNDK